MIVRLTYVSYFPSTLTVSAIPLALRFYPEPSSPPLKVLSSSCLKCPTGHRLDRPYRILAVIA